MLATFCLRLACGMAGALLLLPADVVNPRFYRVQFLTVLGLTALAAVALHSLREWWPWLSLGAVLLWAFAGSVLWSLDQAPGGRAIMVATTLASLAALLTYRLFTPPPPAAEGTAQQIAMGWLLLDDIFSAALLGSAITAMLMGHSYLIAPSMSLTPLLRLLAALLAATLLRMALAGVGLWSWTAQHSLGNLEDETVWWLPLRWGLGFLAPLVLGWMAWQTTRIRSTQSATGILYVVVVFCFLGELTSQLLLWNTGLVL
jgi:hypothetical protein